ncbi:MAG: NAD(+) synthase [Clostridiales bacterium]|nr:NAD(+) synthase [Clostridiales bacterium]
MDFGYIKSAVYTPQIKVADCNYNAEQIIKGINEASQRNVKILVFPELCVTGSTCGDLFYQKTLLDGAKNAIDKIAKATVDTDMLVFVGAPIKYNDDLYSCAVAIKDGQVLAYVPKVHLTKRQNQFSICPNGVVYEGDVEVPITNELLIRDVNDSDLVIGVELGEDLDNPISPSTSLAQMGAKIIVNLASHPQFVGENEYREQAIKAQSAKCTCAYMYANAGEGESTTDLVFAGGNYIAENGKILAKSEPFSTGITITDIDCSFLTYQRSKSDFDTTEEDCVNIYVEFDHSETKLDRKYSPSPFIDGEILSDERANLILNMQAHALKKRIEHTHTKTLVVGVSGGLDSSLALLVAVKAMKLLGRDTKDIIAVTMPCFGTTKRTYDNSKALSSALGVSLKQVNIAKAVKQHFKDIGHDENVFDTTYENSQARERTQILMDIANKCGGMVIGTGDLSELALGWATYNGDHMSMYGVNGSVPKTLMRHLISYYVRTENAKLGKVLADILATPVSPELLPPDASGKIQQKTEDLVGPYELHDFYLFYLVRMGFTPAKVYKIALDTFEGTYSKETIYKWLSTFIRRFFNQQFKRSCLPDGVKIGSVSLSPRGDFTMPTDAVSVLWQNNLDEYVNGGNN